MKLFQVGSCCRLPHYAVVGNRVEFYLWVNEDGVGSSSEWIRGRKAFSIFLELSAIKNKKKLAARIRQLHEENKK